MVLTNHCPVYCLQHF